MSSISRRYAPLEKDHILGFPNRMPCVDWQTYFLKFKDEKGDDVSLVLVKFHMHARKFRAQFPEDYTKKMFMVTLERKARSWYDGLPYNSIYFLKYFHLAFFGKYRESHPFLSLVEDCCEHSEVFIQNV